MQFASTGGNASPGTHAHKTITALVITWQRYRTTAKLKTHANTHTYVTL